jgi:hypothetical protein
MKILILLLLLPFLTKAQSSSIFKITPKEANKTYTIDYQKPKGGIKIIPIKQDSMRLVFTKPGTYSIKILATLNGKRDSAYNIYNITKISRRGLPIGNWYTTKTRLK